MGTRVGATLRETLFEAKRVHVSPSLRLPQEPCHREPGPQRPQRRQRCDHLARPKHTSHGVPPRPEWPREAIPSTPTEASYSAQLLSLTRCHASRDLCLLSCPGVQLRFSRWARPLHATQRVLTPWNVPALLLAFQLSPTDPVAAPARQGIPTLVCPGGSPCHAGALGLSAPLTTVQRTVTLALVKTSTASLPLFCPHPHPTPMLF